MPGPLTYRDDAADWHLLFMPQRPADRRMASKSEQLSSHWPGTLFGALCQIG
jgi:hypothetical protein